MVLTIVVPGYGQQSLPEQPLFIDAEPSPREGPVLGLLNFFKRRIKLVFDRIELAPFDLADFLIESLGLVDQPFVLHGCGRGKILIQQVITLLYAYDLLVQFFQVGFARSNPSLQFLGLLTGVTTQTLKLHDHFQVVGCAVLQGSHFS